MKVSYLRGEYKTVEPRGYGPVEYSGFQVTGMIKGGKK